MVMSVVMFALMYRFFTHYANMPFLGALVLVAATVSAAVVKCYELTRRNHGPKGDT